MEDPCNQVGTENQIHEVPSDDLNLLKYIDFKFSASSFNLVK